MSTKIVKTTYSKDLYGNRVKTTEVSYRKEIPEPPNNTVKKSIVIAAFIIGGIISVIDSRIF
jgi:hypothetical protein